MKTYKTLVCCLLALFPLVAQAVVPTKSEYRKQLEKVFRTEQDYISSTWAKGGCWFLSYTLSTEVKNPNTGSLETVMTNGELWATKSMRYIKTGKTEVLMDEKDVFTIYKPRKMVMHTPSAKKALYAHQNVYIAMLRDSMLRQYNISSCTQVREQGTALVRIDFLPVNLRTAVYTGMSLFVDPVTFELKKMKIQMNPVASPDIRSYTMTVIQKGQKTLDNSWSDIHSKILAGNGRLKAPYQGYQYKELHN